MNGNYPVEKDAPSQTSSNKSKLCARCTRLDLTVDRFIIQKPANSSKLSDGYEAKPAGDDFQPRSGVPLDSFASLHELRLNRHSCAFCGLVCDAMERYSPREISDTVRCSLAWEIHGREAESKTRSVNRTRRLKLSWNVRPGQTQKVYLVLAASDGLSSANSNFDSRWKNEKLFLGRGPVLPKNQALVNSWIDTCTHKHGEACSNNHDTEEEILQLVQETYFGVIDVIRLQLKSLPVSARGRGTQPFVALSYVWGQGPTPYVTSRANIMKHIKRGGLELALKQLPRTVRDAISLVSRLGYRYLWVDSLSDGNDSSAGLRAVKPLLDPGKSLDDVDSPYLLGAECGLGVRLLATRSLEAVVDDSEWNRRAWTFQQRALSRRCLIFAEGRVYFQCRSTTISQDIHTDKDGYGTWLDRSSIPLHTPQELQLRPIPCYMNYIQMYTGRLLTRRPDTLAAFDGISRLLSLYMKQPFLFGLPISHLDLALLWSPTEVIKQHQPAQNGFPTWSWCGWMEERLEYHSHMLDGCLQNVHDWLKHHTWIKWYIRDERGHLQPLSEILRQSSQSPSTSKARDERWNGYPVVSFCSSEAVTAPRQMRQLLIAHQVRPPASCPGANEGQIANLGTDNGPNNNPWHNGVDNDTFGSFSNKKSLYERVDNRTYISDHSGRYEADDKESLRECHLGTNVQDHDRDDERSEMTLQKDDYGRILPADIPDVTKFKFTAILPDHPFGVIRRKPSFKSDTKVLVQYMPILQFWTWRTELHVVIRDPTAPSTVKQAGSGLCQCDILDKTGDWCGTIVLNDSWIRERNEYMFPFIALSDAKGFTIDECPSWTYYIPRERDESEWDLYYVLLLQRNQERGLWERVGLGKVFKAAFEERSWSEIKLG
ncbi:hypothetical protein BDV25DRAFT_137150 [Aspergillus avenaceus]|uniref:Heterokaryon incompatibility domain-containing protein n=1 Tax=Aspergillus avenaceus TaxID=36643 RepID=A0A5N6U3U6_ASPAV|nr:hypothetical protein BDV25DRAFT_137150 [Aspergillus avenaceus]